MEQKTKAIAAALEIEESKLTNPVLSKKLKELKLDGTGNKEALTNRLFEAMKLEPIEKVEKVEKKVDPPKPVKKDNGLKKTAGFYAKYMAGRNNVANQESPIFNFDDLKHVRTLVLPHARAVELNSQKLNSGILYKEVESKTSK